MKFKRTALLLVLTPHLVSANDVVVDRNLSLNIQSLTDFSIDAGAGDLVINGGGQEINVDAKIIIEDLNPSVSPDQVIAKYVVLTLEEVNGEAELVAKANLRSNNRPFSNIIIDLDVSTLSSLPLFVDDGSGDIAISDLSAELEVDDGSGEIFISNVTENIVINDGSGDILLENTSEVIEIDDGSGDLTINNHIGDIKEIDDGSGDIEINNLSGDIEDIDGGSGDIFIDGEEVDEDDING